MNYDYIMGWETENEEGLRGAWDIEQRDKELDADGVTAEVMFADADAITGMASPPFGAGLSRGRDHRPRAGLRRGAGPQPLPGRDVRPQPRAPRRHRARCRSRTASNARWPRSSGWPSSRASAGSWCPTMWHDHVPYNHPDYDPVWAACQAAGFPVHTHSGEAPQDEYNENIGIYLAEVVWWAARPGVAPALLGRLRALPRPEVRRDRGGGLLGGRHDVEVGPVHGRAATPPRRWPRC